MDLRGQGAHHCSWLCPRWPNHQEIKEMSHLVVLCASRHQKMQAEPWAKKWSPGDRVHLTTSVFYFLPGVLCSVMAMNCLFFWICQLVCSWEMPDGIGYWDEFEKVILEGITVIPWGWGQRGKKDHNSLGFFSCYQDGNDWISGTIEEISTHLQPIDCPGSCTSYLSMDHLQGLVSGRK